MIQRTPPAPLSADSPRNSPCKICGRSPAECCLQRRGSLQEHPHPERDGTVTRETTRPRSSPTQHQTQPGSKTYQSTRCRSTAPWCCPTAGRSAVAGAFRAPAEFWGTAITHINWYATGSLMSPSLPLLNRANTNTVDTRDQPTAARPKEARHGHGTALPSRWNHAPPSHVHGWRFFRCDHSSGFGRRSLLQHSNTEYQTLFKRRPQAMVNKHGRPAHHVGRL